MFKVEVDSVEDYLAFDPVREADLKKLDALIRKSAPRLKRHFHRGTPPGEPGMRFKMIGYGPFHYKSRTGKPVQWPVIGVALQKNYISVYFALHDGGKPVTEAFVGKLGELRAGTNNFSFAKFEDLNTTELSALLARAEHLFRNEPETSIPNLSTD